MSSILNSKLITGAITSWPLALVIIALIYKKGITHVIENREVDIKNSFASIAIKTMDDKMKTAKENLPKKDKRSNSLLVSSGDLNTEVLGQVFNEAQADPAATLAKIWKFFSNDLSNIIEYISNNTTVSFEGDFQHCINELRKKDKISDRTEIAIISLLETFIDADKEIKREKDNLDKTEFAQRVMDYYTLCVDALEALRKELSGSFDIDFQI